MNISWRDMIPDTQVLRRADIPSNSTIDCSPKQNIVLHSTAAMDDDKFQKILSIILLTDEMSSLSEEQMIDLVL